MKVLKKLKTFFNNTNADVRAAYIGIAITLAVSLYSLYLQHTKSIDFKAIVKLHGATMLSESVEYRLSLVNSGNTPVAIQRVHFSILNKAGESLNSKVDVIEPIVVGSQEIKVVNLNRHLISTQLRGEHQLQISFEVVDVNANVHITSFMIGQVDIGGNLISKKTKLPSFKINLITGNIENLK